METAGFLPILLLALLFDAVIGDPKAVYSRVPHPAMIFGWAIGFSDKVLNRPELSGIFRKFLGTLVLIALLILSWLIGHWLTAFVLGLPFGWILLALIMSVLLAQKSLYQHVAAVASELAVSGLSGGRRAVAHIVGRDTDGMDEPTVCRSAIESLAENLSDGVVAPVFWGALFGLPGLLAYKMLNTADSMIGHRTDVHRDFGWAAARFDDIANFIPARLTALLITFAALPVSAGAISRSLKAVLRDARKHSSVNAGYPEAAMAGALDLRLAGPRIYGGLEQGGAWMGNGREDLTPGDIRSALRIYVSALLLQALILAGLLILLLEI